MHFRFPFQNYIVICFEELVVIAIFVFFFVLGREKYVKLLCLCYKKEEVEKEEKKKEKSEARTQPVFTTSVCACPLFPLSSPVSPTSYQTKSRGYIRHPIFLQRHQILMDIKNAFKLTMFFSEEKTLFFHSPYLFFSLFLICKKIDQLYIFFEIINFF